MENSSKRTVLVVTEAAFYPPYRGDSARLFSLITNFQRRGWHVSVVALHDPGQPDVDYAAMKNLCQSLFIYYPTRNDLAVRNWNEMDSYCPPGLEQMVQHAAKQSLPQVIISQFVFLSRCLEIDLPSSVSCVKVIDADNIFTDRASVYERSGLAYDWFSTDAAQERRGLLRADIIMAIQECEAAYFSKLVPERPTLLLPHLHKVYSHGYPKSGSLLFVGAANLENASGLTEFLKTALPIIRRNHPNVRLKIAGRICDLIQDSWPDVEFLGLVDDLSPLYDEAAIVLNPTPAGTGLKIKTVEALCHGRCLVTTSQGAQGLERYSEVYCLAETPDEFAKTITWLLDQPTRITEIGRRARRFAANYFDPETLLARFEDCILRHTALSHPCLKGTLLPNETNEQRPDANTACGSRLNAETS